MYLPRLHGARVHLVELGVDGEVGTMPIASGHVLGDHPHRQGDNLMVAVVEDDGRIAMWAMDDQMVAVVVEAPEPGQIPPAVPPR